MKKNITANIPEETAVQPKELNLDELNEVTGAGDPFSRAGDPFSDVPRNPEKPIDDDLRKDG